MTWFCLLLLASGAPAATALPAWLRLGVEERVRAVAVAGAGFRDSASDAYLLNRLRLDADLQPLAWMRLHLQAQDARVFGARERPAPVSLRDPLDLRQGYLELGRNRERGATLRVGRQSLTLGDGRLVGDPNWSNVGRAFDAVRATLAARRVKLDAFAASVVRQQAGFNHHAAGDNLHGLYGSAETPLGALEPYVLWRVAPGSVNFRTAGARWEARLRGAVEIAAEMAAQRGQRAGGAVRAWAGHWLLKRTFAPGRWQPRLAAEYNYASGDRHPGDGRWESFDQLYPAGHDKAGLADQFMWRNLHHAHGAVELRAHTGLTLSAGYHSFWLASTRDALYGAGGRVIARAPETPGGAHVAQEFDLEARWAAPWGVKIDAGYAYILPGGFLKRNTPGAPHHFVFLDAARRF